MGGIEKNAAMPAARRASQRLMEGKKSGDSKKCINKPWKKTRNWGRGAMATSLTWLANGIRARTTAEYNVMDNRKFVI